jgi:HPt (histidine-containing phosphotransfer) domain-containing protein
MNIEWTALPNTVFAPDCLLESCDDDEELAQEVLEDFRQTIQSRIFRLTAAVTAVDPALVRLEAHSIKGISRTIGAKSLAEVGERLEIAGASGDLSEASFLLAEAKLDLYELDGAIMSYLHRKN